MSKCVLVLGTPRSGTSCVAGVLHHLGVPMGERFPEPNEWNPGGFYQDEDFENAVDLFDMHWDRSKPMAGCVLTRDETDAMARAEVRRLIAVRNASPLWGLKSNRMVHFLEELNTLTDLKVIRTYRPKAASVASWRARSGSTAAEATRVVNYITGLIDAEIERLGITPLVVDFRDIISGPRKAIAEIAAFAGVEATTEAEAWIQPNLVRFQNG